LHDDSRTYDAKVSTNVVFEHFEGISPRRYQHFFAKKNSKNKQGEILRINILEAAQVLPDFIDSYLNLEDGIIWDLDSKGIGTN